MQQKGQLVPLYLQAEVLAEVPTVQQKKRIEKAWKYNQITCGGNRSKKR